jgi:hypothetical protein
VSLKVSPLAVEEEVELESFGVSSKEPQLNVLVNRGSKQKTVFSPAFIDDAVTSIRGKITVSF